MRSLLPALLLMLAAFAPAATPNVPVSALDDDGEARWVPFTLTPGNQIRFDLTINGHDADAILDTGVSHSVVSRGFARDAGLDGAGTGTATAIGGDIALAWATPRSLRLGGLSRAGGRMGVIDLSPAATGISGGVDALIGSDILSCCALDIDYDARRFRLLASGRMPFAGVRAPLALAPGSGTYVTELTLGGRAVRPVLIDTGDGSAVTVTRDTWNRGPVAHGGMTSTVAYGLGGTIRTDLAVVRDIGVADLDATDVEVRIEERGGFSGQTGTLGRIGSGFLQRYRVLLDPGAGLMVLRPGERAGTPAIRSTSGLLVGQDRDRLRVLHVMRGSPAETAGWKAGETICAVEGHPVATGAPGGNALRWFAAGAGQTIEIALCDGTTRKLTLRKFY